MAEHNNRSFRVLNLVHDVGLSFAVSSETAIPVSSEVILSLAAATGATVQGAISASGNCSVGGTLMVGGIDVLALAQGKQSQLTSTSQLNVARVIATGATASEATASAFTDLEALEFMTNSIRGRPASDLVLEGATAGPVIRIPAAGGASVAGRLTSTGGVLISGGQGRNVTEANLRVCGAGDLYNTSALHFWGNGVDL